jgi:hypothetical protein
LSIDADIAALQSGLTTSTTSTVSPSAASADSASSASIVPIAAAAGGGVVLIVVVLLIVRRKQATKASREQSQRTVVAFENPMYVSPQAAASQTGEYSNFVDPTSLYDNTANNASAGLYDEPSFIGSTEKDNPLYESAENLNRNELGDEPSITDGMYFVSADQSSTDAGYLDVMIDSQ